MKFWKDILQFNGKYSRKSVLMLSSFAIATLTGLYIVLSDYLLEDEINRFAIDVCISFLTFCGGLAGISVWDKIAGRDRSVNKDGKPEKNKIDEFEE